MSKTMIKAVLAIVMLSVLVVPLIPFSASAEFSVNAINNTYGLANKTLNQMILDVTNWLVGFIIILAFLVIVYGGVRYVAAAGSDDEVAAAKKIITYGVIGLVVAGLSWVIVYTVVTVILK